MLRDLISPYLLRRLKKDVGSQLPSKTEQVLFCELTPTQRKVYRAYITSQEVADILDGTRNALVGIDILRKVCNHPDLLERASQANQPDYGNPARSGKLGVAVRVLQHWQQQDCKCVGGVVVLWCCVWVVLCVGGVVCGWCCVWVLLYGAHGNKHPHPHVAISRVGSHRPLPSPSPHPGTGCWCLRRHSRCSTSWSARCRPWA